MADNGTTKENGMRYERHGMVIESRTMYGTMNRRGGRGGAKVHALEVHEVVALTEEPKPGTYAARFAQERRKAEEWAHYTAAPVYFSVMAHCNGNGQHTGRPSTRLTAEDVTCERCKR